MRDSRAVVLGEDLGLFAFSFCWLIVWDAFFYFDGVGRLIRLFIRGGSGKILDA